VIDVGYCYRKQYVAQAWRSVCVCLSWVPWVLEKRLNRLRSCFRGHSAGLRIHALDVGIYGEAPPSKSVHGPQSSPQSSVASLLRKGNCRSGRPRQTWLQTVESDVTPLNIGLASAYHWAQYPQAWSVHVGTAMSTCQAAWWWWWWWWCDSDGGIYGCHLANTIEQFMLSGNVGCHYHYRSNLYIKICRLYLQCTSVGRLSVERCFISCCTTRTNSRKCWQLLGTPWSGHAVYCNWRIIRVSFFVHNQTVQHTHKSLLLLLSVSSFCLTNQLMLLTGCMTASNLPTKQTLHKSKAAVI